MTEARRPWTLHQRLRTALVVAGVVLGLVLALATVALTQVSRYQDQVTATIFRSVLDLKDLETDLVDADAAVRAFALTGDDDRLAPYTSLDADRLPALAEQMTEDLPRAEALPAVLEELIGATTRWREQHAEPMIAQTREMGPGLDPVTAGPREDGSFADVRTAAEDTRTALIDHRDESAAQLRAWRTALAASLVIIAVAAVAVGAGLWWYLRRWVTGPMDRLAATSRAVSEGDLGQVVRGTGPQEVVELASDVELMRRMLVTQLEQVESARLELEASNRDLEQFAYVASHDLQEPLRKVASFTQLLQRRYGDQLDDRAAQYIEFAADGARRMQRLIQDLLAFSRLGRGGEEPAPVELGDCLADALGNLEESIEESGATCSTAGPLPTVEGHPGALTQLLQNLVGNAIKFRAPDRPPQITLGAERVGDEWELWCADNGIGVEPRHAERVFAIFQRLHAKDAYAGTGIGLAMCQRIVELHGGRIWIEERPDGAETGTTVRWTLPADAPAALPRLDIPVRHNDPTDESKVEP